MTANAKGAPIYCRERRFYVRATIVRTKNSPNWKLHLERRPSWYKTHHLAHATHICLSAGFQSSSRRVLTYSRRVLALMGESPKKGAQRKRGAILNRTTRRAGSPGAVHWVCPCALATRARRKAINARRFSRVVTMRAIDSRSTSCRTVRRYTRGHTCPESLAFSLSCASVHTGCVVTCNQGTGRQRREHHLPGKPSLRMRHDLHCALTVERHDVFHRLPS